MADITLPVSLKTVLQPAQKAGCGAILADSHNLQRFVEAQNPVYRQVCAELAAGAKTSHWMWFVFPQLKGLGHSALAQRFGIASKAEAQAYWQHAVLGARLKECIELVLAIEGKTALDIFGSPDDLKFHSSLTLFERRRRKSPFSIVH